jgi:hypothetical protein
MKRIVLLIVCLLALSLVACGKDPRSVRITDTNKDQIVEKIKDLKGLTVDESRLLFAFLLRHNIASQFGQTPPSLVGKTVGDLISEQRTFETEAKKRDDEQARLAAEAKSKEEARSAELRKAINLSVFQKSFIGSDPMAGRFADYITIKCAYQNISKKDIRAFTGQIRFTDLFNKLIFESGLTISDPIKAGQKATWTGTIDYNQFADSHKSLRNASLENMKVVWLPKSIIYADGTKVGETDN